MVEPAALPHRPLLVWTLLVCLLGSLGGRNWMAQAQDVAPTGAQHPIANLEYLLDWRQRTEYARQTVDSLRPRVEPYLQLNAAELHQAVAQDRLQRPTVLDRSPLEQVALDLAQYAALSRQPAPARQAIALLVELANAAEGQTEPQPWDFFGWMKAIPAPAVLAYDLTGSHRDWDANDGAARQTVEAWLRAAAERWLAEADRRVLSNIAPYGLRHGLGVAIALHDAPLVDRFTAVIGRMYQPYYFTADGLWWEGCVSYHQQTHGNLQSAVHLLTNAWRGGPSAEELALRWPLAPLAGEAGKTLRYPDGRAITLHDTHFAAAPTGRVQQSLIRPFLLPHAGTACLARGNEQTHLLAYLHACPTCDGGRFGGGHIHDDRLALILYGFGRELLGDAGYATRVELHRYFQMHARAHNTAIAWQSETNAPAYAQLAGQPARSATLLYDDGSASNGQIQLLRMQSPGPEALGVTLAERTLLLVAIDASHSYVVDITQLRGGMLHESYLRPQEEEDCQLVSTWTLEEHGGTLADLPLPEGVEPAARKHLELLKDPRTAGGDVAGMFTWTSVPTGTVLQAFVNEAPGSTVIFSRMPRLRPTELKPEHSDDYPGWHLTRRRPVQADTLSTFAAVYAVHRADDVSPVRRVLWEPRGEDDEEAVTLRVELASGAVDTLRLARQTQSQRVMGDLTLGGVASWLRVGVDGQPVAGYVHGSGVAALGNAWQLFGAEVTGTLASANATSLTLAPVADATPLPRAGLALLSWSDGTRLGLPYVAGAADLPLTLSLQKTRLGFSFDPQTGTQFPLLLAELSDPPTREQETRRVAGPVTVTLPLSKYRAAGQDGKEE